MSSGGAIAAMRGKIIRAFAGTGAFSETEAKSLDELGLSFFSGRMFSRMERRGIIIKTKDGKYYMDREYYDSRSKRMKIVIPLAFSLFIAVVIIFVLFVK